MIIVNNDYGFYPSTCQEKEVLNAERTLELSLILNESNQSAFKELENEAILKLGDEEYVIKEKQVYMTGKRATKKAFGLHIFFSISDKRNDDELSGSIPLSDALSFVFNSSGWKFELYGENPKLEKDNFGNANKLALFNQIINDWGVEYTLDTPNRVVKVYPRVGEQTDEVFRYNYNIRTMRATDDTREFRTAIKGYGKDGLEVTYISPKAEKYGTRWQDPVDDERFTIAEHLREECKRVLKDEPEFTAEIDVLQIKKDFKPKLGNSALTVHEPLELDLDTRITEITRFPFDKTKPTQVVLSTILPSEAKRIANIYKRLSVLQKNSSALARQYKKIEEKAEETAAITDENSKKIEENKGASDKEIKSVGERVTDVEKSIKELNESPFKFMSCLGSSTTSLNSYQPIVSKALGIPKVVTHGFSGGVYTDRTGSESGALCYKFTLFDVKSDLIIIQGAGSNDWSGASDIGTINDSTTKTFYGAMHHLFTKLSERCPTARIVCYGPSQRHISASNNNVENSKGLKLSDYNEALKKVAALYSIPVFDAFSLSGRNRINIDSWTTDKVHGNPADNNRVGNMLAKFIRTLY